MFRWGHQNPDPDVMKGGSFSASWTGALVPETSGRYLLSVHADDTFRVTFDGKVVLDRWTAPPGGALAPAQDLVAGKAYPIKVDFKDVGGAAMMILRWRIGNREDVIPPQCLRPPAGYVTEQGPPLRQPVLELPDAQ